MRTRDQQYAISVYQQMQTVKDNFKNDYRKYGVMCHKLPILIRTAGLAQALAFVESRGKDKKDIYKQLLIDLTETIRGTNIATPLKEETGIVRQAREEADLNEYMRLTQQVMAALVWYKRFAQSILGVDASESAEQEGE
jgi:CRISPR-associated protein Cmr5